MLPKELKTIVADNLIMRRAELGLAQGAVAEAAGISQTSLSLIESGKQTPSLETLALLADSLHTTPAALLTPEIFSHLSA